MIHNTRTAFNFFSNWSVTSPRGVDISDIRIENCTLDCEDLTRIQYGYGSEALVRDLYFQGISGHTRRTSLLIGKQDRVLENIRFSDIDLTLAGTNEFLKAVHVSGLALRDVRIKTVSADTAAETGAKPIIYLGNAENLTLPDGAFETKPLSEEEIKQYDKDGRY